jgi:hypothetical protein
MHFLNFDAKLAPTLNKFVPNSTKKEHNLHNCRQFMQIRCQKGAGAKMHKYLVGY